MAGIMAVAAVVAIVGLRAGVQQDIATADAGAAGQRGAGQRAGGDEAGGDRAASERAAGAGRRARPDHRAGRTPAAASRPSTMAW